MVKPKLRCIVGESAPGATVAGVGFNELAEELVVLRMRADPEPVDAARNRNAERSIVETDTNAMEPPVPDRLEVQRRMVRIGAQLRIATPRQGLNIWR